ncbi:MAG: hypothetical protein GY811_05770 [Myxococcales bacterium]|nr:hypothetical protein [Myxococcales bacterium]
MTHLASMVLAAGLLVSCSSKEGGGGNGGLLEDASFGRRVFRPPPLDPVRAVPPHNIHRNGVGPYELAASLQETHALLPSGSRGVELFEADGLFDYRLMRTEGDALLVGVGRRGGVAFISVLDPDIARTESGVGVGAGLQELIGALGALKAPENQGRDSRIITFTALPDTRFIVEKGKVVAAVVMPSIPTNVVASDGETGVAETSCKAAELDARRGDFLALAKSPKLGTAGSRAVSVHFACPTSDRGGALLRNGDSIGWAVLDGQSGEPRLVASTSIPNLSFLDSLDTGAAREEIYAVSERRTVQLREVVVTRLTLSGGRFSSTWNRVAFALEAKTASWIGARMQTADFLVEMTGRDGAVAVGGIYMERKQGALRHVVPVMQIELPVARKSALPVQRLDGGSVSPGPRDAGAAPLNP